jgi:hypothetical protein
MYIKSTLNLNSWNKSWIAFSGASVSRQVGHHHHHDTQHTTSPLHKPGIRMVEHADG